MIAEMKVSLCPLMGNALADGMVQSLCIFLPVLSLEKMLDPLQDFLSKPGTEVSFASEPGRRKVFAFLGFFPYSFFPPSKDFSRQAPRMLFWK